MKFHIYKTENQFLEEPEIIGTCVDFTTNEEKSCKCKDESHNTASKEIAVVDFGKYMYSCLFGYSCGNLIGDNRKTVANKNLVCKCNC